VSYVPSLCLAAMWTQAGLWFFAVYVPVNDPLMGTMLDPSPGLQIRFG
jgi:hypothetical protein